MEQSSPSAALALGLIEPGLALRLRATATQRLKCITMKVRFVNVSL
jgi:hypothetical protein